MKFKLLFLAFTLQIGFTMSQSTITSISISPVSPTVNDTVYIYAELQFPSSDCELDFKAHTTSGYSIGASSQHCLGPLAAICNTVDTFVIGTLPEGSYTFVLDLSTGMAPAPCTPGIAVDDTDTLTFQVSASNLVDFRPPSQEIIYPNPTTGIINFNQPNEKILYLYNCTGELILTVKPGVTFIDLFGVKPGSYILKNENMHRKIIILN